MGRRLGQRPTRSHVNRARLGVTPGVHGLEPPSRQGGAMDSPRYRVIQWATGNTGQRALREVIRHPLLDLAGVLVYDPAKDGADAGELCGEEMTGVFATTDRHAVLKLEAD